MSSFRPFGLHYVRLFLSKRRHTGYTWQVTFLSSYSLLQGLASTATRIGYQPVAVLCLWGEEGLAWFNVTTLVRLKCRWPQMCHRWSHQLSTKIFKHHHVEETISPPQNSMAPKCKATTTYMFVSLTLLLVVCEKKSPCWQHQWCESLFPVSQHSCLTREVFGGGSEGEKVNKRPSLLIFWCWSLCLKPKGKWLTQSFSWMVNWGHDRMILNRGLCVVFFGFVLPV